MLVFFGTRGSTYKGPRKQGVVCSVCGKDEHFTYGVLRYFHIFWIPILPTARHVAMECAHCKKTLVDQELPRSLRDELARLVFPPRRTMRLFVGPLVAALLAVLLVVAGVAESRKQATYLRSPAAGDLYVVKLAALGQDANPAQPYGVLQAAELNGDRLELRVGAARYVTPAGARKAVRKHETDEAGYFGLSSLVVPVAALPQLKQEGAISTVQRP